MITHSEWLLGIFGLNESMRLVRLYAQPDMMIQGNRLEVVFWA
jgi:hypothetical protein